MSEIKQWENVEGAVIPDWLQGRGAGGSGGVLHVIDYHGNLCRIPPGATVFYNLCGDGTLAWCYGEEGQRILEKADA